jgi:L-seryl-tRNA(Ser) seleniumtransferase
LAQRILPPLQAALHGHAEVSIEPCRSQIGSGSLPVDLLPSACLVMTPKGKGGGRALNRLAKAFRDLPIPVIGRLKDGALCFDLRCLEDEPAFIGQLPLLAASSPRGGPPASSP